MLQKKDWLILELWCLVLMLNGWPSLSEGFISAVSNTCQSREFRCTDGPCIPSTFQCDGDYDCSDRSDENPNNCNVTCHTDEFTCPNNRCIRQDWVCDNENDCGDNSDEKNCTQSQCQPDTEFTCAEKSCIVSRWQCDGDKDCPDGSDEVGCNNTLPEIKPNHCTTRQFSCKDNGLCIHHSWICDGIKDCADGADEKNCTTTDVVCNPTKEFDCGHGHCIPLSNVCDLKPDCLGWEDEQPHLCGKNECLINNGGCSHICIDHPNGFQCECESGYILIRNRTCEDINECMEPGICSQICTNKIGSFNCSCAPGYLRDPQDYTRCKAAEGEASLLFAGYYDIRKVALDSQEMTVIVNNTNMSSVLDFDFRTAMIFWIDRNKIYKAPIDNANDPTVVVDQDMTMQGLSVDWIYGHIYWTNAEERIIGLANFEGDMRKTVINTSLQEPSAIAVNPLEGWMFWTDLGENARIERAGMDGSHRLVIIDTEIEWPIGITLDLVGKKLYWVDAKLKSIASCNYDGSGRRTILNSPDLLGPPFSITTFEDHIFWTDFTNETIYKANKFNGTRIEPVAPFKSIQYPMVIHVYHPNRQPGGNNQCRRDNGRCSHLCLPAPKIDSKSPLFTCACPDGLRLSSDGLTCVENGSSEQHTSLCDRVGIAGQQNILEILQLCETLKATEQREVLYKTQLEANIQENLELAQKQERQYQQQLETLRTDRTRNRRAISWLFKEQELQ